MTPWISEWLKETGAEAFRGRIVSVDSRNLGNDRRGLLLVLEDSFGERARVLEMIYPWGHSLADLLSKTFPGTKLTTDLLPELVGQSVKLSLVEKRLKSDPTVVYHRKIWALL